MAIILNLNHVHRNNHLYIFTHIMNIHAPGHAGAIKINSCICMANSHLPYTIAIYYVYKLTVGCF